MTQTEYHNTRFTYDPRRARVWRAIARYLQPWIESEEALLELGAGYGEFTREIRAAEKWALDQNPGLRTYWDPSVHALFQSAMDRWPIADESLGTVFASNFFEHFAIEEGAEILMQAKRTLRPGGRLIAIQPNFRLEPRRYFDDYTHKTAFTDNGFQDFLRALGLRIVHAEPRFMPFTMKSRFPTAEWLVSLYLASPIRPLAGQFLVIAER
ncbi:MAG TPA: class I SAM-dependent methyltransferase [Bryobacteraceae bacterium]